MDLTVTTEVPEQVVQDGSFSAATVDEWLERNKNNTRQIFLHPDDLAYVGVHKERVLPLLHPRLNDDHDPIVRKAKVQYFYSYWFQQQPDEFKENAFLHIGFVPGRE